MPSYESAYFLLFSAICDTLDLLGSLQDNGDMPESVKKELQMHAEHLKHIHQQAEEMVIGACDEQ